MVSSEYALDKETPSALARIPVDIFSSPESQGLGRNDDAAGTAQLLARLTICDAEPTPGDAEPTPGEAEIPRELTQGLREIVQRPPSAVVVPFLSRPILGSSDKIVAYRGGLLAVAVGPGCYRLLSIGEQILWDKRSLSLSDIPNADDPKYRVLNDCQRAPSGTKSVIMSSCKGIVGVAHRGYHTLNRASATKNHERIGDCIVEVEWTDKILESLPHLSYKEIQGVKVVKTFETRADWHVFRGKALADWEIYWFAKKVDTGDIPPRVASIKKRPPKAIESAATSKKKSRARKPSPFAIEYSEDDG